MMEEIGVLDQLEELQKAASDYIDKEAIENIITFGILRILYIF
jgi:hypothetical protein